MSLTIEQRLAALGIDSATAYVVSDRYVLIHRDPEPDETNVDDSAHIYFRIVDLNGDPALPLVTIDFSTYVDQGSGEVLAYDGTIFQPGWTGPASLAGASVFGDPYCYRDIVLDQSPTVFGSEAEVTVRVALAVGTGGFGHYSFGHIPFGHAPVSVSFADEIYTFTVEDTWPLHIIRAEGIGPYQVRVIFDDTQSSSSLLASSWTITRQPVDPRPVADLTVLSCELDDRYPGTAVVLTCSWEQTPSGPYTVICDPVVTDESGNPLAVGTASFLGWTPVIPGTRAWRVWDHMVPLKNRTEDAAIGDLRRFINCIDEQLAWNLYHVDRWTDRFNPDFAIDDEIDMLLEDFGNPFGWYDLELTATQKRRLLRLLVPIYQAKGTAAGIEDTIRVLLGVDCLVVPAASFGWRLGYDALGVGRVARLVSGVETFNLLAILPADLSVIVDGGLPEVATLVAADFADPTAVLASELVTALASQITGAVPVAEASGTQATVIGAVAEPFAFSGGETLVVDVNGIASTVTMHVGDIAIPGAATAIEVAARIDADLPGFAIGGTSAGVVTVTSELRGALALLSITGGTMAVPLGLVGAAAFGTDANRLVIRGTVAGADRTLEIVASPLQVALALPLTASSTGGCILAAGEQRLLYSFDLEVLTVVDATTESLMRKIANYMKPAHTHLLAVRIARGAPPILGWRLGESKLGTGTSLGL